MGFGIRTAEEVKKEQDEIAKHFRLGWYYGVRCSKCCGVYPKAMIKPGVDPKDFYYQCEVCGRRTNTKTMPWLAEKAWNNGETYFESNQISMFAPNLNQT